MIDSTKNQKIQEIRENVYKKFFEFVHDKDPQVVAKEKYVEELKSSFRYHKIETKDYSFPSQEFMNNTYLLYQKNKAITDKLFSEGDLLTFNIDRYDIEQKKVELASKNKTIISTVPKFSLYGDYQLAYFSNGKLFFSSEKKHKFKDEFINLIKKNGYKVNDIEYVDFYYITKLNARAQKLYKDKIVEVPIKEEKAFIEDLYKDNNICLTATSIIVSVIQREYLALFSDGRFIVSNQYMKNKYNRDLDNKIRDFAYANNSKHLIRAIEYVPHSYIEAIYEKAASEQNFLPLEEAKNILEQKNSELENNRPELRKEIMDQFIDNLFANNNKCVSITNLDNIITTERDSFALFEDDRFIVNEDKKDLASAREFAYVMMKKGKFLVPEYVPAKYLSAIYTRALQTQKSAKDIYVEKLKKKAKRIVKLDNITHHDALERIAKFEGFNNWKQICEINEDHARILLGKMESEENQKKIFGL